MAVEKVLQEALALPREDRKRVARELLDSLEPDDDWEEEWADELNRRLKAIDEGRARLIPHDQVVAELRARFTPR